MIRLLITLFGIGIGLAALSKKDAAASTGEPPKAKPPEPKKDDDAIVTKPTTIDNDNAMDPSGISIAWPAESQKARRFGVTVDFGRTPRPSTPQDTSNTRDHKGVDIPGDLNDKLVSCAEGEVIDVNHNAGAYGKRVIVQHKQAGKVFYSVYAHCNEIHTDIGEKVEEGQPIATMGTTGNSIGVHLHFEVRLFRNDRSMAIDPIPLFNNAPSPIYWDKAIRRV